MDMVQMPRVGRKWHIAVNLLPVIALILVLKYVFHILGWEVIELNALFTSIIAASTFLLGFLIAGVIADYKESERMPGDLACSLEAIYDEAYLMDRHKSTPATQAFLAFHVAFIRDFDGWFHRKVRTKEILAKLTQMNDHLLQQEDLTKGDFITRIKHEQSNVRRMVIRIHTIRDTSFVQSGYTIVEILAVLLIFGLLLLNMEPVYESLFIVGVMSFIILYMLHLIKDLDNPFDFQDGVNGSEISLRPLKYLIERLDAKP